MFEIPSRRELDDAIREQLKPGQRGIVTTKSGDVYDICYVGGGVDYFGIYLGRKTSQDGDK